MKKRPLNVKSENNNDNLIMFQAKYGFFARENITK